MQSLFEIIGFIEPQDRPVVDAFEAELLREGSPGEWHKQALVLTDEPGHLVCVCCGADHAIDALKGFAPEHFERFAPGLISRPGYVLAIVYYRSRLRAAYLPVAAFAAFRAPGGTA